MPKVRIYNRTKVTGTMLPNGVKVKITAGATNDQGAFTSQTSEVEVAVGKSANYDVNSNYRITVKPENTMMQGANWTQTGRLGNDIDLYIIPLDYGVQISLQKPAD